MSEKTGIEDAPERAAYFDEKNDCAIAWRQSRGKSGLTKITIRRDTGPAAIITGSPPGKKAGRF